MAKRDAINVDVCFYLINGSLFGQWESIWIVFGAWIVHLICDLIWSCIRCWNYVWRIISCFGNCNSITGWALTLKIEWECWSGRFLRVVLGYVYLAVTRRSFNFAKFPTKSPIFFNRLWARPSDHCCLGDSDPEIEGQNYVWMSWVTTKSTLRQSIRSALEIGRQLAVWMSQFTTTNCRDKTFQSKKVDCWGFRNCTAIRIQQRNLESELRLDVTESRLIQGIAIKHLDRNL